MRASLRPIDGSGIRPARRGPRAGRVLAAMTALACLFVGGRFAWNRLVLSTTIDRGLELISSARDLADIESRLTAWDDDRARWGVDAEALAERIIKGRSLDDARVRVLLTHLTGCDFGTNSDEWRAWLKARARSQDTTIPMAAGRRPVRLEPRWAAPVGLTAWFSVILALDGQVYVASLGNAIGDSNDPADGVVRVDGKTGEALLMFSPPDAGNRDIAGLAAGDDCLFVACRNGYLYCISPDGDQKWKSPAGGAIASPPLSIDLNNDDVCDAVFLTQQSKLVALSGAGGKTLWVTQLARGTAAGGGETARFADAVVARPSIALIGEPRRLAMLVSSADGRVARVDGRTGKVAWQGSLSADIRGGPIGLRSDRFGGLAGIAVSQVAAVWTLGGDADRLSPRLDWVLSITQAASAFASPRTLTNRPGRTNSPLLICCVSSATRPSGNSVCAFGENGLAWRFPPGGNIWATPAIADLNDDKAADILVASSVALEGGRFGGLLTVIGDDGRHLARVALPAAGESSPFDGDTRLPFAAVEASPVVADVDGDDRLDVLVADHAGILHCYSTRSAGPVEWGCLGGDSHNTFNSEAAYAFGQTPIGYQWKWRP